MPDLKSPKILLTGGTGYLGSNILKKLVLQGYQVILLKRSFSNTFRIKELENSIISYDVDKADIKAIFSEHKIDIILHCATDYGRKNIEPLQVMEANLTLPLRLLELGKQSGVACFINTDTVLDKRINYYSISKAQFNEWLQAYKNDLACVNIALEHFYGPGDDITKFVSMIIDKLSKNEEKIDLTLGEQKRDFVYIDDVANAFLLVIEKYKNFGRGYYKFEVGSGNLISIKDLVLKIKELTGNTSTALNFGANPYRENEVMEHNVDLSEIKKLGWASVHSLEEGLKETIKKSS